MIFSVERPSWNLARLPLAERDALSAHRAESLARYRAALELASRIYSQNPRRDWRRWAEQELRRHPELEAEARKKLNRLKKEEAARREK